MCDQNSKPSFITQSIGHSYFDVPVVAIRAQVRRVRLWELPHNCHCPVMGVCFSIETLRRLVNKTLGGKALANDYEMHVGAVAECTTNNPLSKVFQRELDRRYQFIIQDFKSAKTIDALAQRWNHAKQQGNISGAFWAALTHPASDSAFQETLCRDIHMIQHQAGAEMRMDVAKCEAVMTENHVLTKELAKVQARSSRLLSEKTEEIERLNNQLLQVRAEDIRREMTLKVLYAQLERLQASTPDLDSRINLKQRLYEMSTRQQHQNDEINRLRMQLTSATQQIDALRALSGNNQKPDNSHELNIVEALPPVGLDDKKILCVGGRSGNLVNYRGLIEKAGGHFVHHDGGLEDNFHLLDSSLAAADLVICQTGCISHNAYWRVKDHCKRTGTQCIFVDTPSASTLSKKLVRILSVNKTVPVDTNKQVVEE